MAGAAYLHHVGFVMRPFFFFLLYDYSRYGRPVVLCRKFQFSMKISILGRILKSNFGLMNCNFNNKNTWSLCTKRRKRDRYKKDRFWSIGKMVYMISIIIPHVKNLYDLFCTEGKFYFLDRVPSQFLHVWFRSSSVFWEPMWREQHNVCSKRMQEKNVAFSCGPSNPLLRHCSWYQVSVSTRKFYFFIYQV